MKKRKEIKIEALVKDGIYSASYKSDKKNKIENIFRLYNDSIVDNLDLFNKRFNREVFQLKYHKIYMPTKKEIKYFKICEIARKYIETSKNINSCDTAKEIKQIKKRITELENKDFNIISLRNLGKAKEQEIERLNDIVFENSKSYSDLSDIKQSLEFENNVLENTIKQKDTEIDAKKLKIENLHKSIDRIVDSKNNLIEKNESLSQQNKALKKEIAKLKKSIEFEEVQGLERDWSDLNDKNNDLIANNESLIRKNKALKKEIRLSKEVNKSLHTKLIEEKNKFQHKIN